jgi:Holliday junction DNA helicase RuvA
MIGRLRGEIVYKHPPQLMLDVSGVGYELEAPMSTFYLLPEVGAQATLLTHFAVREDAQVLYGFAREGERELFRALLKITGVGGKIALSILSGMSVDEFVRAIQAADSLSLMRIPGVGKRTAERLILELKDRLGQLPGLGDAGLVPAQLPAAAAGPTPSGEAVGALVTLGYRQPEAERMVRGVEAPGLSSEDLIRAALKAAVRA